MHFLWCRPRRVVTQHQLYVYTSIILDAKDFRFDTHRRVRFQAPYIYTRALRLRAHIQTTTALYTPAESAALTLIRCEAHSNNVNHVCAPPNMGGAYGWATSNTRQTTMHIHIYTHMAWFFICVTTQDEAKSARWWRRRSVTFGGCARISYVLGWHMRKDLRNMHTKEVCMYT